MSSTIQNMLFRFVGCDPPSQEHQDMISFEISGVPDYPTATFPPPPSSSSLQVKPIPIQRLQAFGEIPQYNNPSYFCYDSFTISPYVSSTILDSISSPSDMSVSFENFASSPTMTSGFFDFMSPVSLDEQQQRESFYLPSSYSSSVPTLVDYSYIGSDDGVSFRSHQPQLAVASPQSKIQTGSPLLPMRRVRQQAIHKCPYCPHVSNRVNNMKEHILTHDPNRPKKFKCDVCHKLFARKHDMKRHHRTHERRRCS